MAPEWDRYAVITDRMEMKVKVINKSWSSRCSRKCKYGKIAQSISHMIFFSLLKNNLLRKARQVCNLYASRQLEDRALFRLHREPLELLKADKHDDVPRSEAHKGRHEPIVASRKEERKVHWTLVKWSEASYWVHRCTKHTKKHQH